MNLEEKDTFELQWRSLESKLHSFFYRKGCPEQDTIDLVQETALRAVTKYSTLRGDFNSWVFGIAKFVFIEFIRKKKRTGNLPEDMEIVDRRQGPGSQAIATIIVEQCLNELKQIDRQCLVLHDVQGYKFEKISELLGISLSNAHYHVEKARKYLRGKFPELLEVNGVKVKEI